MTPPSQATTARPELVSDGVVVRRAGWIERATSVDHKSVGLLYVATALMFLAVAALEFVLMRVQLIVPESTILDPEIFNRLLSTFGATAVVLFALPFALGLIGYLVPLQIGARSVALPRLNLLSYWLYLGGGVAMYASYLYRPSEAGLAAAPPLSHDAFSPTAGVDAWILGVGLATLGFVLFAVNLIATVTGMRAPGMAWRRLPLFSWAATVIAYVLLVIGPVMLAALSMLMIDRHFDGIFFDPGAGGSPLLYEHLSWIFFTGAYVSLLLFAFGTISEVLPTFARKPVLNHRAAVASFIAVAVFGLLAWMQNMYTAPIPLGWEIFAMLAALALVVPVGLLLVNWIGTLWGGALQLRAAPLYAIAAVSAITLGLGGELMYSVIPVGWQLDNTTAAHQDTVGVIAGSAILAGFAALHYWFPKLCGRTMGEGIGKLALVMIYAGLLAYGTAMWLAGLKGQPVDVHEYFEGTGLDGYNLVASVAIFVFAAGVFAQLANAANSYRSGVAAGPDPWGGATLEWFALSPPPEHNFDAVPDVRSAEPLHDIRAAVRARTETWSAPEPVVVSAPPEPVVAEPAAGGQAGAAEGPGGDEPEASAAPPAPPSDSGPGSAGTEQRSGAEPDEQAGAEPDEGSGPPVA